MRPPGSGHVGQPSALRLLLALASLLAAASPALADPFPSLGPASAALRSSPWYAGNWLSCSTTSCSGTLPDGRQVRLERQSSRMSPTQTVSSSLAGQSLVSTSERAPITTASLAGPVLVLPPTRTTTGTVFDQPLSLFTSSSGVVTGTYGGEPVNCAADGWGAPGNPYCF